jgi:flagellar protein FlgJ
VSIHPSSDLVLDVVKAADPAKSVMAAEKLTSLAASEDGANVKFSAILNGMRSSPSDLGTELERASTKSVAIKPVTDMRTKVFKDLEQLVLRNLVETMLPKDTETLFGHGTAGDIWKSMLADALSKDIGKSVDLGLAKAAALRSNYASAMGIDETGQKVRQDRQGLDRES